MAKTLDDVKYCPKCGAVGKIVNSKPLNDGGKVTVFNCQNEKCTWFDTGWPVQTDHRGEVAEPPASTHRAYPPLNDRQKTFAQRQIDEARRIYDGGDNKDA